MSELMIGWTTAPSQEIAEELAEGLVRAKLAACVYIDGPGKAFYSWEGKMETAEEYRLMVKFLGRNEKHIQKWLKEHHPYDVPEWVAVEAEAVSNEYASWARTASLEQNEPR